MTSPSPERSFHLHLLSAIVALLALLVPRPILAEEVPVPVARQAELLVRVSAHDRNMRGRATGGKLKVLIVNKPDDADSRNVADQMASALRKVDRIAGVPPDVSTIAFSNANDLADKCKADHVAVVYFAPGIDAAADIARALDGVDVLSVASLPRHVPDGIVLGFDLVSGKPTILINLPQAKKQHVDIDAEALHIMKVIQ